MAKSKPRRSKAAIVLAGGGITGGVYQVGALRAVDDFLVNLRVTDFDLFVGNSAGSLVASLLANGVSPDQMFRGILGDEAKKTRLRTLKRFDIYGLAWDEYARRVLKVPRLVGRVVADAVSGPDGIGVVDALLGLGDALPAGLLDNKPLEKYCRRILTQGDRANQFHKLDRELYIPAVNLDTGRRMVFGTPEAPDVPISRAVRASAAIPMLFVPVEIAGSQYIDGGVEKNMHLDVAISRGAKLIIAVNPIVPLQLDATQSAESTLPVLARHISDRGLAWVADQVYRTLVHTRTGLGLARIRRLHPDVDIVLLEPSRDDVRMFVYNIMRYSARVTIAEHGFLTVRDTIEKNFARYRRIFTRHGIEIDRAFIDTEFEALAARRFSRDAVVRLLGSVPFIRRRASGPGSGAEGDASV